MGALEKAPTNGATHRRLFQPPFFYGATIVRSSKALIDKLDKMPAIMRTFLTGNDTAEVQIANIDVACWAVVQLAFEIKRSVDDELSDLD